MAPPNPLPSVGATLRSRAYCTQGNQTSVNIRFWAVQSLTTGGASMKELADAMSTQIAPHYKALMVIQATYYGLDLGQIWPGPPGWASQTTAGQGKGTILGNSAPLQDAGIISLRTANVGRAYRGRVYVPFLAQASIDVNGQALAAYTVSLLDLGNDYTQNVVVVGATGTTTLQPLLWHKKTNSGTTLTHYLVRNGIGTQRRRGAFGRPNFPPF